MDIYNMHEAKTQLSELVAKAERGEEVVIARAGKPVVKLVAVAPSTKRRQPGLWRRKYPHLIPELEAMADAIDAPLPEDELRLWEGRGDETDA